MSRALIACSLMAAPGAVACVGGLVSAESTVTAESQLALISYHADSDSTDIAVLLTVPASDQAFGALIPLPDVPVVDEAAIDPDDFVALETRSRPEFFVPDSGDGGDGLFSCGGDALGGGDGANRGGIIDEGVAVDVGPVTAQFVRAEDRSALTTYLSDNGFELPAGADDVIDGYIAQGNGFLAFKRNDAAPASGSIGVGVHFSVARDLRTLPLRIAQLGAPAVLPVTVFVAADDAVGADAPFTSVHGADIDAEDAVADYAGAIDALSVENGGHVFVFEGNLDASVVSDTAFAAFVDADAVVSRLSARIPRAALDRDVSLAAAAPSPSGASAAAMRLPRQVDLAFAALLGITVVVRRRRRRDAAR